MLSWASAKMIVIALLLVACQAESLSTDEPQPQNETSSVTVAAPTRVTPSEAVAPPWTAVLAPTEAPASPLPTESARNSPNPTQSIFTHRIGVWIEGGESWFFDRQTGQEFVPRGFNYVRVAPMPGAPGNYWHATLNPGYYDPEQAETALTQMQAYDYNVVRIFIDCCRPGANAGDPKGGISQAYLENTIDFLDKANAHGIYVLMIFDLTPAQGGYDELWQQCCTTFDGENLRYLTRGGHTAERRFNRDFILALIKQGAPIEAIFAYDLTNEVHFNIDKPPFSLDSGRVRTANGQTYDMSIPEDKQRMMDENLVYWIDQQRANILEVDPTALVTVSFPAINTGQTTVNTAPAVYASTADFVDLHAYLGWGFSLDQYMTRFGITEPAGKPIILGEFGSARRAFPDITVASRVLQEWQAASCDYGFDGWLFWTWDVDGQDELWHGLSENGEIATALSPAVRPNPCVREQ
jgi:hypothetical protein